MQRLFPTWLIAMALFMLNACGPSLPPQSVAREFWIQRVKMDSDSALLVERAYAGEARLRFEADRAEMLKIHPDLAQYRFELEGLKAEVQSRKKDAIHYRLTGNARIYDGQGGLVDQTQINDRVVVKQDCLVFGLNCPWLVDYQRLFQQP
jgi:hypothetical protein